MSSYPAALWGFRCFIHFLISSSFGSDISMCSLSHSGCMLVIGVTGWSEFSDSLKYSIHSFIRPSSSPMMLTFLSLTSLAVVCVLLSVHLLSWIRLFKFLPSTPLLALLLYFHTISLSFWSVCLTSLFTGDQIRKCPLSIFTLSLRIQHKYQIFKQAWKLNIGYRKG